MLVKEGTDNRLKTCMEGQERHSCTLAEPVKQNVLQSDRLSYMFTYLSIGLPFDIPLEVHIEFKNRFIGADSFQAFTTP